MKTVLITGACKGLGKATAEEFLRNGYRVISGDICYKITEDLRPSRELLRVSLDVSSAESVENASSWLKQNDIYIDILVNNAGIYNMYPLSEIETLELSRMLDINSLASARTIRAFLPDLARNRGRVIQISSESAKFPGLFQPYQVSKLLLEAYSRSVRQELMLKDIRLVIIQPGAIQTELSGDLDHHRNPVQNSIFEEEFNAFVRRTTRYVGKVLPPEKVARYIFHAATCRRPRYIYRINNNPLLTAMALLPDRIIDNMVKRMVKKK